MPYDLNINVSPEAPSGDWSFTPPAGWSNSLTVNPYVIKRNPALCNPDAIFLGATIGGSAASSTPDPSTGYIETLHDVYYIWDGFYGGNISSYNFTAPTRTWNANDRHANGHQNARWQYSPKVCFTYYDPGSITIGCWGFEVKTKRWGFGTITLGIADQNLVYGGANTVYVSAGGNFPSQYVPLNAQTVTSSNVQAVMNSHVHFAGSRKRLMFHPGETYSWPNSDSLGAWYGAPFPGFMMTRSEAPGSNPLMTSAGGWRCDDRGTSQQDKEVIFDRLDFTGPYNDLNTSGPTTDQVMGYLAPETPTYTLLNRLKLNGMGNAYSVADAVQTAPRYITMNDCDMENFAFGTFNYKISGQAHTGNRFDSRVDSYNDIGGGGGWVHRTITSLYVSFANSSFRRQGNSFGQLAGQWVTQPMERVNYDGSKTGPGDEYYVYCNFFEGSWEAYQSKDAEGNAENPVNAHVAMNTYICGYQCDNHVFIGSGGTDVFNNLWINPNSIQRIGNGFQQFCKLESIGQAPNNHASPVRIYCNTGINYLEAAVNPFGEIAPAIVAKLETPFTNVTEENNCRHNPRMSPTQSDGPFVALVDVFGLQDTGYRGSSNDLRATMTSTRTSGVGNPDVFDHHALATGSLIIGNISSGLVPYLDWRGLERPHIVDAIAGRTQFSGSHIEPDLLS